MTPQDLNYTITAATPLPSAPYALPFTVLATRNSPEGAAQISYKAFIPILGTIPSEVPNFYPVTTDPTLIFLILRDPPGGASHTTIEAGSTFTTGISIDGMMAAEESIHVKLNAGGKTDFEIFEEVAPGGLGEGNTGGSVEGSIALEGSVVAPDVTVSRTSDTHYSYAFTFKYEFSTSDDPYVAGHPSDVIVGGGIDVIVSEALNGNISYRHILRSPLFSLRELHFRYECLSR